MTVWIASGAKVCTRALAIVALVACRSAMSALIRWLKNCIGSRSTFHR